MTKITEFKLNLDTHKDVFAPGDQIPCKVILTLDGQLQTKGIKVAWAVIWHCKSVKYQTRFFTLDKGNCWLFGNGRSRNIHSAGTSIYPFRVTLSAHTPSSFESRCGYVRYTLEVKILKASTSQIQAQINHRFAVREEIDHNLPIYRLRPSGEGSCVGYFGDSLTCSARIDGARYCPQDRICMNVDIYSRTLKSFIPKLKLIRYIQHKKEDIEKDVVLQMSGSKISNRGSYQWNNRMFQIPQCGPTVKSEKINVWYLLELKLAIDCSKDLKILLPIIIGTVPLDTSSSNELQQHELQEILQQDQQGNALPQSSGHMSLTESELSWISPPSYQEALNDQPPPYEENGRAEL